MPFRKLTLVTSLVLLCPPFVFSAQATVIAQLTLDHLVGRADAIFVGKVVAQKARWTAKNRRIVTETTVEVSQAIVGSRKNERVTVRTLGGTIDGIGMWVSGAPRMRLGQEVLTFSEKRGSHRFVVGMRQGLFAVNRDTKGRRSVTRTLAGLTFARRTSEGLKIGAAQPSPLDGPQRLTSFITTIKTTAARCAKQSDRCLPARLQAARRNADPKSKVGGSRD